MTSNPPEIAPKSAADFLAKAASLLTERGQQYDTGKERSGPKIAAAFNAITGKDLTPAEVYLLLQLVKDVRQWNGPAYHQDSAEDCVSYAALKAEALACGVDCCYGHKKPLGHYEILSELLPEGPGMGRRTGPANRRQNLYNVNDRVFGINRRLSCVFGRRSSDLVVDEDTGRNFKEHYDKLEGV